MSLKTLIQTGLSDRQWEDLWARLVSNPKRQIEAMSMGFEEWRNAVLAEGENRQFIHYATTGKRISRRAGIAQVIADTKRDLEEQ